MDGDKYTIEYKWAIKNHALSVHFKGFEIEYYGIIFFDADAQEVVQVGVDKNGRNSKSSWMAEYGRAVWSFEYPGDYGDMTKMASVYTSTDSKTMKGALHSVDDYGSLSNSPVVTLEYKRQKAKKAAATR
jgi:hypothetical protein